MEKTGTNSGSIKEIVINHIAPDNRKLKGRA